MSLKSTLKSLKLNESTISTILGVVVILIVGILAVNFFSKRQGGETIPSVDVEEESKLPTTHTVAVGEDLWKISEKYYGTGYNWVDIVKENNITDPGKISEGQTLTIPNVTPRMAVNTLTPTIFETITQTPETTPIINIEGETKHKVIAGENLWKIAENYYSSGYNWTDIAQANSLVNPAIIEVGQEIVIPQVEAKTATVIKQEEETGQAISDTSYTVVKGDSLWTIAVRAYGDGYKWSEIAKGNNLLNPGIIHPGNIFSLPR